MIKELCLWFVINCLGCCQNSDNQTNKPPKCDHRVESLSHHQIMLIRYQNAPLLARIYRRLSHFQIHFQNIREKGQTQKHLVNDNVFVWYDTC